MRLQIHSLDGREYGKAVLIGIMTGILLAILNVATLKAQLSPLPKPLALAFAETLFGISLPLPVGLLFHVAWVTFFSAVYVVLFRDALTLINAIWLAAILWLVALVVFFPIVGWGVWGSAVSPKLIVPVTISHLLFAVFLWALCRAGFRDVAASDMSGAGER